MVWNSFGCSIYWKFHNPNWRTHIFQPGRAQPPTRTYQLFLYQQNVFFLPGYLRAMSWDMEFGKSRVKFHDLDLQCRFSDAMLQDLQQNYGFTHVPKQVPNKKQTWQQIGYMAADLWRFLMARKFPQWRLAGRLARVVWCGFDGCDPSMGLAVQLAIIFTWIDRWMDRKIDKDR